MLKRRKKENVAKYSRNSTAQYIKEIGGTLAQGSWTDDETLLIIVLLKVAKEMEMGDKKVHDLYDKYITYQQTVSNGLQIRAKSVKSINSKIETIRQHEVFG